MYKILIIAIYLTTNLLNAKDLLLVDFSVSLDTYNTKKQIKSVVKRYLRTSNDILAFNDKVFPILNSENLKFGGGTALSKGLSRATNYSYIILLTDGIPNDEKATVKEAERLKKQGSKICSVYITNKKKSIPNVLKTISDKVFATREIKQVFELCNSRIKKELIGKTALKIQINPNKYDF